MALRLISTKLVVMLRLAPAARRLHVSSRRCIGPVEAVTGLFVDLHAVTGLPWWAVVASSTFALRSTVTLPLSVYQQHVLARLEAMKPVMSEWTEALKYNIAVRARRDGKSADEATTMLRTEVPISPIILYMI